MTITKETKRLEHSLRQTDEKGRPPKRVLNGMKEMKRYPDVVQHSAGTTSPPSGTTNLPLSSPERTLGASAVGTRASAVGTRASAVGTRASAVGTRASAVGTRASAVGTRASAVGTRASAVGTRASAVGTRASAVGTRASAVGTRASAATHGCWHNGVQTVFQRCPCCSFSLLLLLHFICLALPAVHTLSSLTPPLDTFRFHSSSFSPLICNYIYSFLSFSSSFTAHFFLATCILHMCTCKSKTCK